MNISDIISSPVQIRVKAEGDSCPPATQDIGINIKNRQKAIDTAGYGPLNPKEVNAKFWKAKANKRDIKDMH